LSNPPTKAEVTAARKRMCVRYKLLLEEIGTKIFVSGMTFNDKVKVLTKELKNNKLYKNTTQKRLKQIAEDKLRFQLNITSEHHAAAEYYKLKTEWHPVLTQEIK
jgi:hypothetical protein